MSVVTATSMIHGHNGATEQNQFGPPIFHRHDGDVRIGGINATSGHLRARDKLEGRLKARGG
jgi:hypothetical protein